jgi:hypothetical protein
MTKTTKSLLVPTVLGLGFGLVFSTGLINVENEAALYVALPTGAIFLGLFLISLMLEQEAVHFDQEHEANAHADHPSACVSTPK